MRNTLLFAFGTAMLTAAGAVNAQSYSPYGPPQRYGPPYPSRAVVVPPPPPPSYVSRMAPTKPVPPRSSPAPRAPRADRN